VPSGIVDAAGGYQLIHPYFSIELVAEFVPVATIPRCTQTGQPEGSAGKSL
jgi:hypothetical protein